MATANGYGEPYETVSDSSMQSIMKVGRVLSIEPDCDIPC